MFLSPLEGRFLVVMCGVVLTADEALAVKRQLGVFRGSLSIAADWISVWRRRSASSGDCRVLRDGLLRLGIHGNASDQELLNKAGLLSCGTSVQTRMFGIRCVRLVCVSRSVDYRPVLGLIKANVQHETYEVKTNAFAL